MKKVAIITARGGSKRIPRKNIKDFLGKPIIAYCIQAALDSKLFDEVMVSTDDDEIATLSKQLGAKVPFSRSSKNADDHATTADVILEVLNSYKSQGKAFTYGCCIYPTAAFVNSAILKSSFDLMLEMNYDSVFPAIQFSFPIQRALKADSNLKVSPFYPEFMSTRSQDLEPSYHDAGQFYWFQSEIIITKKKLVTDNSGIVLISEMEAQDIDHPSDWKVAEFKYKLMHDRKN